MGTFESKEQADADKKLDKLLLEQSSELLEALQHGGEEERRVLAEWLSQSKRHVRTHLFVSALEEELKHIDPERQMPIPDVKGKVAQKTVPFVTSSARPSPSPLAPSTRMERVKRWKWAAAAAVMLVVAGASMLGPAADYFNGWREFDTAVGEQRTVSLSDGSIVQLNTGTRIKARISTGSRDIRLLEGEALFKVAKDRMRPFTVKAANVAVVAVGTQFNVYQLDDRTRVSVLEGKVKISSSGPSSGSTSAKPSPVSGEAVEPKLARPLLASAGEEVEVRQDGNAVQSAAADVANAAAWTQRRVVFKQEPLANVVTQFNRYRKTSRLRVDDANLGARKYSGTFDVDDPHSLEDVLANEPDVVLEKSGDEIVIRAR